jgi:hypothetical protein
VAERTPDPIREANIEYNMQELTAKLEEVRVVLESIGATFAALGPKVDEARGTVVQVQGQVQQVALQAGIAPEAPPPVADPAAETAPHAGAGTPAHATPPPATPRPGSPGRRGDKDDD